jgi:ankyrin repeat protein
MDETLLDRARSALRDHDADALRALLAEHAELRARINDPVFPFDSPALAHFASSEDTALIDVLLDFGADPNRKSDWWAGGFHPLHGASDVVAERLLAAGAVPDACAASHLDRPHLLARLIEEDPARVHERGGDGQTPLHFARSRAVVDLLLAAGADPDARDVDHRATPAQWMLDRRRDLAAYLIERGATPDIFLAAALGLTDRVRDMLRHDASLLELRTTQGEYGEKPPSSYHIYMWTIGADLSPLQAAAMFGQTEALRVMRELATPRQRFLAALAGGDAAEARLLLSRDAGLMQSLRPEDRHLLAEAGWAGNTPAVELMLELGFDPLIGNANGATVLHCAAWQGSATCVAAVLRQPAASALVNLREPVYGATPLGWCCHGSCHGPRHREHARIARMLLEAGTRLDPKPGDMSDEVRAVIEAHAAGA